MASDDDSSSAVGRLAAILATAARAVGTEDTPTPRELAELLWLAQQLQGAEAPPAAEPSLREEAEQSTPESETGAGAKDGDAAGAVPGSGWGNGSESGLPSTSLRIPLRLPTPEPSTRTAASGPSPLLAPAPPMLHHPLALERALRPLKRRVPSPRARLLDERATADRIARLGAHPDVWLPVLRPAHDRWLRLHVVHDTGPTMPVWRPLVRELVAVLAQSGVFRTVTLHPATPDGRTRHVPAPADGRTVTLVVSDCMGPQWRPGPAGDRWYATLHHWATHMPLAIVQPLPEHLWPTTALPAEPGILTTPGPAAPTARLCFEPYEGRYGEEQDGGGTGWPGERGWPREPDRTGDPGQVTKPRRASQTDEERQAGEAGRRGELGSPGGLGRLGEPGQPEQLGRPDEQGRSDEPGRSDEQGAFGEPERLGEPGWPGEPGLPDEPGQPGRPARDGASRFGGGGLRRSVALPVLEPGAAWLANWAALVADPGGGRHPGAAARLPAVPEVPAEPAPDAATASAQGLVLRFRATASPEAFRLAGHLALAVPSVSVMRLVQRAVEREPRPQHLAEVILSGMLTAVPGPPGSYEFRPGVRELLLRTVPRTVRGRTREFLAQVGGLIDERAGLAAGEFRAQADGADGAFATVSEETVRRLGGEAKGSAPGTADRGDVNLIGGRYRLEGRRGPGHRVWQAVDTETGDRVVVHLYPEQPAPQERFLREAETLAGAEDPRLARILDYGVHGGKSPYLVAEFVDGLTLAELVKGSGPAVSLPVFARLVCDVRAGLEALHAHGLVRGQPGWDGLLLRPDGTVMISRFALGEESRGSSPARDIAQFEELLVRLAAEVPAPPGYQALVELIRLGSFPAYAAEQLARARDIDPLHIRMLGPLSISRSAEPLDVPSPEAQALLCMLTLAPGRRVTYTELARGLWEDPPLGGEFPHHRMDDLAGELTRILGPGTLAATSDGYALHAPGAYVDAVTCEEILLTHRSPDRTTDRRRELFRTVLGLFHGTPLDGVPGPAAEATRTRLAAVRADIERELGTLGTGPRRTLLITTDTDLSAHPETRISLEYAVHEILSLGALPSPHHEIHVRDDGYLVRFTADAYLLPVLVAALRWLPGHWAALPRPPRLRVAFRQDDTPTVPVDSLVLVVVTPSLYDDFAESSAAAGPQRFRPVYGSAPDSPPLAWYCPLPAPRPEDEHRDLVRGPFITRDLRQLGIPAPGRTAVVHTRPDGPLTLLDPARPYGGRPPRPTTYYEVDLTPQRTDRRTTLPSSGKGDFTAAVELSWRVADPVAFVRGGTERVAERLLGHLSQTAPRITGRHSPRRAVAAQRALQAGLGKWPVPGLAVTCEVRLAPEWAPAPEVRPSDPAPRPLSELLTGAGTVLVGFDGPMARLFASAEARKAALDLLALVAEHRDPEDALTGRPLGGTALGASVHPLDVLRAFDHDDRLAPLLRARLDELELRAVPDAPTTHHSVALIRTLHGSGRRVSVTTDVCEKAVHRYLERHRLPLGGIHGRSGNQNLLMPHPGCLQRALSGHDAPALLIGTTLAELGAAQRIGLPFIGLARNQTVAQQLRDAGCEITVPSLTPLLEAARVL